MKTNIKMNDIIDRIKENDNIIEIVETECSNCFKIFEIDKNRLEKKLREDGLVICKDCKEQLRQNGE
jgi:NAD-dependent SIR2 family protein deacetylase